MANDRESEREGERSRRERRKGDSRSTLEYASVTHRVFASAGRNERAVSQGENESDVLVHVKLE